MSDIKENSSHYIDKKSNKQLAKGLKSKDSKPSWWRRNRRKKLVRELQDALSEFCIKTAWVHTHFINAEERKVKNITVYVDFGANTDELIANRVDMAMDAKFKKHHINIINVNSLQPAIKEFVFKDVSPLI